MLGYCTNEHRKVLSEADCYFCRKSEDYPFCESDKDDYVCIYFYLPSREVGLDKLNKIFEKQYDLNCKIDSNFRKLITTSNIELKRIWINQICMAIQCETSELLEGSKHLNNQR